jgi:hypothetical protein
VLLDISFLQTNSSFLRLTFYKLCKIFNEIAAVIQVTTKQEILVIIDDLDKLELARVNDIYRDNIKAICQPGFRIIYTIPIAVLRDKFLRPLIETETNDRIVFMPVIKLFEKGQSRQPNSQPRPEAKVEKQGRYLTSFQRKLLQKSLKTELRPEYRRRIEIILLADAGQSQTQICKALECSVETARHWSAMAQAGQAHHWNNRPMGRPKAVNEQYLTRLKELDQSGKKK